MFLKVESATTDTTYTVDLAGLYSSSHVVSEATFHNALVGRLCLYADSEDHLFDEFIPLNLTAEGHSMDIPSHVKTWLKDLSKLAYYILDGELTHPSTVYLAVLESRFWEYMDFDNIEDWADEYVASADDAAEYGKLHFGEQYSGDLFAEVQHHMDWESYGEEKIDDLTVLEWGTHSHYFTS